MDLDYMRKVRYRLRLLNSWPNKELNQPHRTLPFRHNKFLFSFWLFTLISQVCNLILFPCCTCYSGDNCVSDADTGASLRILRMLFVVLQIQYIRNNTGKLSFFELGHSYITALITVINVQRVTLMWKKEYRELGRLFVQEMHLLYHKNMSEYAMKTYNQVHNICKLFTNYLLLQMSVGVFLFNTTPMLHNLTTGMYSRNLPVNGTFVHSCYYALPFDYTTNFIGYLVVFFMNWVLTYDAGCCFCVFDLYISLIVFHAWGHLKILDYHLRHFPLPAMAGKVNEITNPVMYSEEESKEVTALLKKHINHHHIIMKLVQSSSDAFGSVLCAYFTFHQVCCCILLLECSAMDKTSLMEYGVLTMIVFQQLMQVSIVFELLGSKSEVLMDAAYGLPWEYMNVSNRKMVLFFLYNVQTPIAVKAAGLVPVGVQTMAGILKTSVSYFVMLRAKSD
ncbi:uncharacterized protein LOC113229404 [Hyposmocoma kahamanoa]|uniref:uncharacterized protein LOC113229404 n=1 Tax=Hyposmocoma kahamanoa TaxID=1477025 RepID=UPI000E6D7E6E|nr:uncharacterized protein LOC113229404 [Hyposmocoma kahamanoa]